MHTENNNPLWTADRAILPYKRTQIIQKKPLKVALNKIKTYSNQNQTLNELMFAFAPQTLRKIDAK